MPDDSITLRDPFLRAKAAADARYGCWPGWLLTGAVGLGACALGLALLGSLAGAGHASLVASAAYLPVGLATLVAFARERSRRRERLRLIDELWRTYAAEASRARDEPVLTPRATLLGTRARSA